MSCKKNNQFTRNGEHIDSVLHEFIKNNVVPKHPHIVKNLWNEMLPERKVDTFEELDDIKEEVDTFAVDYYYAQILSDDFKEKFGDWQNNPQSIENGRLHKGDTQEPSLIYDSKVNAYYYRTKDLSKEYFPLAKNGLSYIYNNKDIRQAVSSMAAEFFRRNQSEDYRNQSFIQKGTLKEFVQELLQTRADDLYNEYINYEQGTNTDEEFELEQDALYDKMDKVDQSTFYIDEWVDELKQSFTKLGYKITEGKEEEDNLDDTNEGRTYNVVSAEIDAKNNVNANIRALLSSIPHHTKKDNVFNKPLLMSFNEIYKKLEHVLANKVTILEGSVFKDKFKMFYDEIESLSSKLPYFKSLLELLNDDSFTVNRQSEFVQAFNKARISFLVSELTRLDKSSSYKFLKVSDVNSKHRSIRNQWGFELKSMFKGMSVSDIKKDFENELQEWLELKKQVNSIKEGKIVENTEIVNDIIVRLDLIGVDVPENAFRSFVGDFVNISVSESNLRLKSLVNDSIRVIQTVIKGDVNILKANPFDTQGVFKKLAQEIELLEENGIDTSISAGGKKYWVYTNPTYLHNQVNTWKADRQELERFYINNPEKSSSQWLKHLLGYDLNVTEEDRIFISNDRIKKLNIGTFNAFQNKKTSTVDSDPVDGQDISKIDFLGDNIHKVLAFAKGKQNPKYNTLIPADKSTLLSLELDYHVNTNTDYTDGKIRFDKKVINIFYDYFKSEYKRMITANDLIEKHPKKARMYAHYMKLDSNNNPIFEKKNKEGVMVKTGNAFKSQLFKNLSFETMEDGDLKLALYKENGTPVIPTLDSVESKIKAKIQEVLEKRVMDTGKKLSSMDFFKNNYIDSTYQRYYESQLSPEKQDNWYISLTSDYVINSIIANVEYSKIFTGEVYNYKNPADFTKRVPGTYTDGMYMHLNENDPINYNVAIVNNVEVPSKYFRELKESYGEEVANFYKNVDTTDAQAWITPARWKFLVSKTGMWNDNIRDEVYNKMIGVNKRSLSVEARKLAAQPLKGTYFSENNGKPVYLKYSQYILSSNVVKESGLGKLLKEMKSKNIDEVVTVSGIKAGTTLPNKIHTEEGKISDNVILDNVMELDNRHWKLQQNLPVKNTKETLIGSQIQKNMLNAFIGLNNPNFEFNGVELSADDMKAGLHETIGELSLRGFNKIINDFGVNEDNIITRPDRLYSQLVDEAKKRNLDRNLILALQKEIAIAAIPQSYGKFMNMFASIVNKKTVKIKTNGGSFIQAADFGFADLTDKEKAGVKWFVDPDKGLKPPIITKDKDGKETTHAGQILIPYSYLEAYLKDSDINLKSLSVEEILKIVDSKAFKNVIGYRIPNQALASNDALEIVGLLPDTVGDTIIAYSDIPTKTGSDFDIDKMFIMLPSLTYNKTTKRIEYPEPKVDSEGKELDLAYQDLNVIQNRLIEQYKAVLLHPEVAKKVFTPIDHYHVKDYIKYLFEGKDLESLELMSPLHQVDVKFSFLAGKAGIGQIANMLVDHNRGLDVLNYFKDYKIGWGNLHNEQTILDREYSEELSTSDFNHISRVLKDDDKTYKSKYPIADTVTALLNGMVDIAKDDYVTSANWSTQTTNVGLTLLRAGMNPFMTIAFIGQPIIKQYIDFIINKESKLANSNQNIDTAFRKLLFNDMLLDIEDIIVNDKKITSKVLTTLINKEGINAELVAKDKYKDATEDQLKQINDNISKIVKFKASMEDDGKLTNIENASLRDFEKQIKGDFNMEFQMAVYNKFRKVLESSKQVVLNMKLMKTDVEGMGKDLSSRLISENIMNELISDNKDMGELMNVKDKLRNPKSGELTMIGHYFNNSNIKINKIIKANPKLFTLGNKNIENAFNTISLMLYDNTLQSQELADKVSKSYYSYMFSKFAPFENVDYVNLFTNLADEIVTYKDTNKDNYFINQLEFVQEGDYKFIQINNVTKNEDTRNDLYDGWRDLMDENPELSRKLLQYSYYSSGFTINIKEFFSSIPHELMVVNKVNQFVSSYGNNIGTVQTNWIKQFFKHNMDDNAVVPKAYEESIIFPEKDGNYFVYDNKQLIQQKPYLKHKGKLYELLGYTTSDKGVYVETNPLGKSLENGKIYEYSHENDKSKIYEFDYGKRDKTIAKLYTNLVRKPVTHFSKWQETDNSEFEQYLQDKVGWTEEKMDNIANEPIMENVSNYSNGKTASPNVKIVNNIFKNKTDKNIITAYRVDKKLGLLESFKQFNAIGNPIPWAGKKPGVATQEFLEWLTNNDNSIEPKYKQILISAFKSGELKGKTVEYYKNIGIPSHATVIDYLANEYNWNKGEVETQPDVDENQLPDCIN